MPSSKKQTMPYRLALDLGSTSLGWAILQLRRSEPDNEQSDWEPYAIMKAGARIFSDGRQAGDQGQGNPSLAAERREKRGMRRRRDRLLMRKASMMRLLIKHGFFPKDELKRKALETLNPYQLRAEGLNRELKPEEFARALFHINQRRGFKSNRKTDTKENDASVMKTAISATQEHMQKEKCRTVGELLYKRMCAGNTVRARFRQNSVRQENGRDKIEKSYDLYINRAMIEQEFDALWTKQAEFNPKQFTEEAREQLKNCLLLQRPLKPATPGRCTLLLDEPRAPLALPSTQRFRIYQEVNNLRILGDRLQEKVLTKEQRDTIVNALERRPKKSFDLSFKDITTLLQLSGATKFNLEDIKRKKLNGNATSQLLSQTDFFGKAWFDFDEAKQDEIVVQIVNDKSDIELIQWLQEYTGIDEAHAEKIANASLPEGYGSLSAKALKRILPELRKEVITYAEAAKIAGFHHSWLAKNEEVPGRTTEYEKFNVDTGEIKTFHIFDELPYYGEFLRRHVGFPDSKAKPSDLPEKYFGRIANPTVHIGLNQIRTVVNALIKRYGHPEEVIVEVARELKQNKKQRDKEQKIQAANQKRNKRMRAEIAKVLNVSEHAVQYADIQKMILWEELNPTDAADRKCPYSGQQISLRMLLSDAVEVEHILPFSRTLDDSLNNKTVAMREANRIKGNRTPWEAKADFEAQGWKYEDMMHRVIFVNKGKRYRFGEDGYQLWLRDDKSFLARALNDTRYLSRVSREYLSLICPQGTRVIPGQMTAKLRHHFGLNDVLGLQGEKNRNDHRHHAVDACVIAVTDQGMLQRFANANKQAQNKGLDRLVEDMPLPWATYRDHVERVVESIKVSHKPDHGYEGDMFDATIYGLRGEGQVTYRKIKDNVRQRELLNRIVVPFSDSASKRADGKLRHGTREDGSPKPYMGLWSRSNYCIEVMREESSEWAGEVIERYRAYQVVAQKGRDALYDPHHSMDGKPLIMRLMINDTILAQIDKQKLLLRVMKINSSGGVTFVLHNEANINARYTAKLAAQKTQKAGKFYDAFALHDDFFQRSISPSNLRAYKARRINVSPIGEINDPGFKG